MVTYVLILMLAQGYPSGGVAVMKADFAGEEACKRAGEAAVNKAPTSRASYVCVRTLEGK